MERVLLLEYSISVDNDFMPAKPFNMSKTFMEWEKFLCPRNALYSITRSDTTQILKEKTNSLFYATLPGYIRVSETPSFLPGIGKWVKRHRK